MANENFEGKIYFVGGAPRSGTTVTHALLCTAKRMNAYNSEISYVTPIIQAYTLGLNNWNNHTCNFFAEREHFRMHMYGMVNQAFLHIHRALREPDILCVKDPLLTPYFPRLADLLGERAQFITVIRNPYDVVRSRQEVARKAGSEFTVAGAQEVCRQYIQMYQHINNPKLSDQLIHFRYEDLLTTQVLNDIKKFTGCDDISTDNIWSDKETQNPKDVSKNPWFSPKYHGAIDLSSRLSPLDEKFRAVVNKVCEPLMTHFDYKMS